MAALFAVFSSAPRVFLEHFGFSPMTLGLLCAGVVVLVFGAATLAPRLAAGLGIYRATMIGLGCATTGAGALLFTVLVAHDAFPPFLAATAVFLFGVGIASPLSSLAALEKSPPRRRARRGAVRLHAATEAYPQSRQGRFAPCSAPACRTTSGADGPARDGSSTRHHRAPLAHFNRHHSVGSYSMWRGSNFDRLSQQRIRRAALDRRPARVGGAGACGLPVRGSRVLARISS